MANRLPLPRFRAKNVLAVWERTDELTRNEGLVWYLEAHNFARGLDASNVSRSAGVIAALSPQVSWDRNKILAAKAFADDVATGHTGAMLRQANRILQDYQQPLDVLRGPKVREFFRCIVNPYCLESVCIDRHAVAIALARDVSNDAGKYLQRVGAFQKAQDVYREAATLLGGDVLPMQVQAVTWCQWRKES
jgi:hypothetical protein